VHIGERPVLRVGLEAFVYESLLTPLKVLFVFVTVKARVGIIHAPSTSASLAFPGATHLPTLRVSGGAFACAARMLAILRSPITISGVFAHPGVGFAWPCWIRVLASFFIDTTFPCTTQILIAAGAPVAPKFAANGDLID